jgi:hypothetical protein
MALRSRIVLVAFVLWTAFVWVNRISNTLRSDTESTGLKVFSTVLSVVMVVLAVAVVVVVFRAWRGTLTMVGAKVLMAAAAVTVVVWLIRVPQILISDAPAGTDPAGFKAVHLVLGVISVVLAALVWQIGMAASRTARGAGALVESPRA